jgi:RNA polymerase sigma-70 factor, ECF subfamily
VVPTGEPAAAPALVELLSPQLYRFLASQMGSRADAEGTLQDMWLRIHRVRHTYRPGEPVLPWMYAIGNRVRGDSYRKWHRIASRETGVDVLPELALQNDGTSHLPPFDELVALVAALPEAQGSGEDVEGGRFNLEEAAHATSSTVGAVNLQIQAEEGVKGAAQWTAMT